MSADESWFYFTLTMVAGKLNVYQPLMASMLEFTIIHSKLWDVVSDSCHYLGYMTVSPNQALLDNLKEILKQMFAHTNLWYLQTKA